MPALGDHKGRPYPSGFYPIGATKIGGGSKNNPLSETQEPLGIGTAFRSLTNIRIARILGKSIYPNRTKRQAHRSFINIARFISRLL